MAFIFFINNPGTDKSTIVNDIVGQTDKREHRYPLDGWENKIFANKGVQQRLDYTDTVGATASDRVLEGLTKDTLNLVLFIGILQRPRL